LQAEGKDAAEKLRELGRQLTANYLAAHQELLTRELGPPAYAATAADAGGAAGTSKDGGSGAMFDSLGLAAFLDRLSDFDTEWLQPVVKSGILAGDQSVVSAAAAAVGCTGRCDVRGAPHTTNDAACKAAHERVQHNDLMPCRPAVKQQVNATRPTVITGQM
jgi:hypothetical protein